MDEEGEGGREDGRGEREVDVFHGWASDIVLSCKNMYITKWNL